MLPAFHFLETINHKSTGTPDICSYPKNLYPKSTVRPNQMNVLLYALTQIYFLFEQEVAIYRCMESNQNVTETNFTGSNTPRNAGHSMNISCENFH